MSVSQNKISDLKWKPDPKKIRTQEIYKDDNVNCYEQDELVENPFIKKKKKLV